MVGNRQSEFPPARELLQYSLAWFGLREEPLSLTAQVKPVAPSFHTAMPAPAEGFESWLITAKLPAHRKIVTNRGANKLARHLLQNIKSILSIK